jgi:uncharacterized phage protein (TIGR02218 family)
MKRLMPSGLISFLQANPNCLKADLFVVTLPTGTILYATEGQLDITIPSGTAGWAGATTTFKSTTNGLWTRGAITSEASFQMSANTMALTCLAQAATSYPGLSVGLLNAALHGLFDAATVTVYTAYMPLNSYGNVSNGIETKFYGTITKVVNINRTKVEFECADPVYLLDMKVPARLLQSNCSLGFCDANCTLVAATYTQNFTAKTGSTQWVLTPVSAFTQAAAYFTQGVVKCLTGNNAGLSQTVKLHDGSGNLNLMNQWLLPVVAGDTFSVIAGCDKTMTACKSRKTAAGVSVDNSDNFVGMPFTPVPTTAL